MLKILCKVVLILLWFSLQIFAQERKHITTFEDYFLLKSSLNYSSFQFNVTPLNSNNNLFTVRYAPNVNATVGFGAYFKGLGASFSLKISQPSAVREQRGESHYTDFRINSLGNKVGFDLYYQDYKGYYIQNPQEVFADWQGGKFPQRNDLRLRNTSANVFFIFNHDKFSYRSAFIHDERQERSAGTFILTGSLGHLRIDADSSLIPPSAVFKLNDNFRQADFYTFAIIPGYAYNLVVFKRLYLSVGVSTLLGMQYQRYQTQEKLRSGYNSFLKGLGRLSFGYNGNKWVWGFIFQTDFQNMNTESLQFQSSLLEISIFAGLRFHSNLLRGRKKIIDLQFPDIKK